MFPDLEWEGEGEPTEKFASGVVRFTFLAILNFFLAGIRLLCFPEKKEGERDAAAPTKQQLENVLERTIFLLYGRFPNNAHPRGVCWCALNGIHGTLREMLGGTVPRGATGEPSGAAEEREGGQNLRANGPLLQVRKLFSRESLSLSVSLSRSGFLLDRSYGGER